MTQPLEPINLQQTGDEQTERRVVAAVKEYQALLDAEQAPQLEHFLASYPELRARLRPALEGLAMLHAMAEHPRNEVRIQPPDAEFTARPIGDFQIVGELGRGGMGVVYEAIQLSLGRRVALKVLPFASGLDAGRLQRFRNEAYAAAQLHHTNIVPVYAVGSDRGIQYYAMQRIEGHTLAALIDIMREANSTDIDASDNSLRHPGSSEKSSTRDSHAGRSETATHKIQSTVLNSTAEKLRYYHSVVRMVIQATQALEHAHQYGVVHRDIKPGNLLLDGNGKVWVTDFGLAQIQQAGSQLTRSGDALGTVRYMSPEQAAGNRAMMDHRTDIYSLGVTLYELLTLRPAITGNDYREMLNQVAERDPLPPRTVEPSLPIELDTIVRKAIAKEPTQRYTSALAFGADLQSWLEDKPIAAKPPSGWERFAKWRRRNSSLVNLAAASLSVAFIGLILTTFLVWQEQQRTRLALDREMQQRAAAEASFQQARTAVDTFSELSETELAYRPEVQSLRRRILETSLDFYRNFLVQRSGDANDSQELTAASNKVQRLVDELKLLDDVAPLLLLMDPQVRDELRIDSLLGEQLELDIAELQAERESVDFNSGLLFARNDTRIADQMRTFVAETTQQINASQLARLKQIGRQQQLPFTFLTTEVSEALQLSSSQRQQISRIIQESRPDRGGPPPDRPAPDRPPPRPFGSFPPDFRSHGDVSSRPQDDPLDAPSPPGDTILDSTAELPSDRLERYRRNSYRPPPGGPREGRGDFQAATELTVALVLQILTAEQQTIWRELIGPPFEHFRRHPDARPFPL
jgi:serine/threonine protein kinase